MELRGKIVREAKVASEPDALVFFFKGLGFPVKLIGLEAGPLSQWLHAGLMRAGFEAVLLETRHVKAALSAMTVKTDRKDARGLAQLLRMGWFRPVHAKSIGSREIRALLVARKQLAVAPAHQAIQAKKNRRKGTIRAMSAVLAMTYGWPAAAEKIEAALARAYQNNPQLNAQRATVRQTDESVAQALSGYRPTVSANASAGKDFLDAQATIPTSLLSTPINVPINIRTPLNTWSVGVNASQSLLNAQTPNRTRAAEAKVFAARETLRVIEQSVLLSAASVYMDVLRDTATLDLQRDNVRVLRQALKVTQDRYDAGLVTTTDVDQAQAQLAAAEAALAAAESTLITTRANYRRIIGNEAEKLSPATPVDRFSPRTLDAAIAQSLSENPSVTAAMYDVDVAQLQVKIAEAGLYPTLALQGGVQQLQLIGNDFTLKLFNSAVQTRLTVPLLAKLAAETVGV